MKELIASTALCFLWTALAIAQRGGQEWLTSNADAQRSSWIRTDAKISVERLQSLFQKFGFSGSGTRYQTDDKNPRLMESLAQTSGQNVVMLENVFTNLDQSGRTLHTISIAESWSSLPPKTFVDGSPHIGQAKLFIESSIRSVSHESQ